MPRLRKRSARTTNIRFRSNEASVRPYWTWIMSQSNLKMSVLSAIKFVQDRFGSGDLPTALMSLAENAALGTKPQAKPSAAPQPPKSAVSVQRPVKRSQPKPSRPQPSRRPRPTQKPQERPQPRPARQRRQPSSFQPSPGPEVSNDGSGNDFLANAIKSSVKSTNKKK